MKKLLTLMLLMFSPLALGSPIPDFPFLYVSGNASEEVPTESAQISFTIEIENPKSEIGEAELQKASVAMIALLKQNGIPQEDIDASNVSKTMTWKDLSKDSNREMQFTLRKNFSVKIKDLHRYPRLAELFIESDAVSDFHVVFHGGNGSEMTKRLRIAALKDAREKAETLASSSGVTLGKIHSISEYDFSELGEFIGENGSGSAPHMPPSKEDVYSVPPTMTSSFSVKVLYRIDDSK